MVEGQRLALGAHLERARRSLVSLWPVAGQLRVALRSSGKGGQFFNQSYDRLLVARFICLQLAAGEQQQQREVARA